MFAENLGEVIAELPRSHNAALRQVGRRTYRLDRAAVTGLHSAKADSSVSISDVTWSWDTTDTRAAAPSKYDAKPIPDELEPVRRVASELRGPVSGRQVARCRHIACKARAAPKVVGVRHRLVEVPVVDSVPVADLVIPPRAELLFDVRYRECSLGISNPERLSTDRQSGVLRKISPLSHIAETGEGERRSRR